MKPVRKTSPAWMGVLFILLLAGQFLFTAGCARVPTSQAEAEPPASSDPVASPLQTGEQRLSYALGMVLGSQFREQAVDVDPEFYLAGLKDALAGDRTRLTDREAAGIVNNLQRDLRRKQFAAPASAGQPSGIEVSFKLDPRLTKSMYMGDRWVSPPTFTILQVGREAAIEARAHGTNLKGKSLKINPQWTSENPAMMEIVPDSGDEVTIMVRHSGQTRLRVEAGGIAKTFTVNAKHLEDSIKVEISQGI